MPKETDVNATDLHANALIVDGLVIAKWGRPVFEAMHRGGLTAANCTCSIWENFRGSMDNLAQWRVWFEENDDLLLPVRTTEDIQRAKAEHKVGICLGWQNLSGIEDRLSYLGLFRELGVGIMQLTYNTRNLAGSGCYESRDGGLSDFGRDVVREMNRLRILCDLSHVGPRTSREVIEHSQQPVCYSHCLPSGLKEHPRNKSDEQLRFLADHGGFVGVTMFPPFLRRGTQATLADYIEAIAYVLNIVGEDQVGIGTDFTQGHDAAFFEWISRDKGDGRRLVQLGEITNPEGLRELKDYPNLTAALVQAGWPESRIRKLLGESWVRFLRHVWGR
jgi:membrane dipeptidase